MAVVTPVPSLAPRVSLSSLHDIGVPGIMATRREIVPEPLPFAQVIEDKIYVAVGKEVKESRMTLTWAVENSRGKKICIIYVLVPAQKISMLGAELPVSAVKEEKVREHREMERHNMQKLLDEYLDICGQMGVRAEKLFVEKGSIEKGILELISLHGIRKLVMGAASDRRYTRKMVEQIQLKSRKALCIRDEAPIFCHIWFICNGQLIYTREGSSDRVDAQISSPATRISTSPDAGPTNLPRNTSTASRKSEPAKLTNPVQDMINRVFSSGSDRRNGRLPSVTSLDDLGESINALTMLDGEENSHEWDRYDRRSASQGSAASSSSSGAAVDAVVFSLPRHMAGYSSLENGASADSSPSSLLDGNIDNNLCNQLEQAWAEVVKAKEDAHQEAIRRRKVEKDILEAVRRVKALENKLSEELRQKRRIEEALVKEEDELQKAKNQQDEAMDKLRLALEQTSQLESQIAESHQIVWEYEQKIISAVGLLQSFKDERDQLQIERDNALREAEDLRKRRGETSSTSVPHFFSEISFQEIEEATQHFDPSLKIGEGGYGSIYKGVLHHTEVAIKMLHSHSMQGPSEFQQEVDVLSKVRHPHLITLIGACPDACSLVYEYLPNGSLEDRLCCKDNTTPLSWQTRIRIATELCSALIFLHSCKPHSIVHGDVKPANVLLDAHFVSKLGDFGICRLLRQDQNTTLLHRTDPKGTFAYMDPEFMSSGELSPKSDVYSFGIILLRLLTGKAAVRLPREVENALDQGSLKSLLDPLAGDWPFVQAEQLAHLALRCCDVKRKNRPGLSSEVWRVLEPMRAFCGGSPSFKMDGEEGCSPPSYFICPILQEIMQDPHVAADGFTYEAEALRGWLESGHNTSPMTNLPLTHTNLVPNRALRSAIQEWLHSKNQ